MAAIREAGKVIEPTNQATDTDKTPFPFNAEENKSGIYAAASEPIGGEEEFINQAIAAAHVPVPSREEKDIKAEKVPLKPLTAQGQAVHANLAKQREEAEKRGGSLWDQIQNKDQFVKLKSITEESRPIKEESSEVQKEESYEEIMKKAMGRRRHNIEEKHDSDEEEWGSPA